MPLIERLMNLATAETTKYPQNPDAKTIQSYYITTELIHKEIKYNTTKTSNIHRQLLQHYSKQQFRISLHACCTYTVVYCSTIRRKSYNMTDKWMEVEIIMKSNTAELSITQGFTGLG